MASFNISRYWSPDPMCMHAARGKIQQGSLKDHIALFEKDRSMLYLTEKERTGIFRGGLMDDIASILRLFKPTTLAEAINLAQLQEKNGSFGEIFQSIEELKEKVKMSIQSYSEAENIIQRQRDIIFNLDAMLSEEKKPRKEDQEKAKKELNLALQRVQLEAQEQIQHQDENHLRQLQKREQENHLIVEVLRSELDKQEVLISELRVQLQEEKNLRKSEREKAKDDLSLALEIAHVEAQENARHQNEDYLEQLNIKQEVINQLQDYENRNHQLLEILRFQLDNALGSFEMAEKRVRQLEIQVENIDNSGVSTICSSVVPNSSKKYEADSHNSDSFHENCSLDLAMSKEAYDISKMFTMPSSQDSGDQFIHEITIGINDEVNGIEDQAITIILLHRDQLLGVFNQYPWLINKEEILFFAYERMTNGEIENQLIHKGLKAFDHRCDEWRKLGGEVEFMSRLVPINIHILRRATDFLNGNTKENQISKISSFIQAYDFNYKLNCEMPWDGASSLSIIGAKVETTSQMKSEDNLKLGSRFLYSFEPLLDFQEEAFKQKLGYAAFQFEVSRGEYWNLMKCKFMGKLIILIWGWYYKDIWKFSNEFVKEFTTIITQNLQFGEHPGCWNRERRIAWI